MHAEPPRHLAPRLPLSLMLAHALLWLGGVLLCAALLLASELRDAHDDFDAEIDVLFAEVEARLRANEAVLNALAAYLRVEGDADYAPLREYTEQLLGAHPHVYMAQVQRRLPRDGVAAWQRRLRSAGVDLTLRGTGDELPDKPSYRPVLLAVPERPEAAYFRGLDLDEVDFLREAVSLALRQDRAATSQAFEFVPGEPGYAIVRPVHRLGEPAYGELTVAVLVRAHDLLPAAQYLPAGLELTLWHGEHTGGAYRLRSSAQWQPGLVEARLFPRLQLARNFASDSQPLALTVSRPLGWWIIDPWRAAAFAVIALAALAALLAYAQHRHRRREEERSASQRLYRLANYDTLTGLPNRNLLADRIEQALSRARRSQHGVALCFLDLDGFKTVNDTAGHEAGDTLLQQVAERLRGAVREQDTVGRLSGDEFVIVLESVKSRSDAERVLAQVREAFVQAFAIDDFEFLVNASIGLAMFPEDGSQPLELLRAADKRMYAVKHPEWERGEAQVAPRSRESSAAAVGERRRIG